MAKKPKDEELSGEKLRQVEEAAERFSEQAIPRDAHERLVPQRGVDLTKREPVRVVVSAADGAADETLFRLLEKRLQLDSAYDFELW